jgi:hypothetical protein
MYAGDSVKEKENAEVDEILARFNDMRPPTYGVCQIKG